MFLEHLLGSQCRDMRWHTAHSLSYRSILGRTPFLQRQYLLCLNSTGFASFKYHGCHQLTIDKFSATVSGNRVHWLRMLLYESQCALPYGQMMQGSAKVQMDGIFSGWKATNVSFDVTKEMGSQCIQITVKVTPLIQYRLAVRISSRTSRLSSGSLYRQKGRRSVRWSTSVL